jgi:hypothetical protein
MPASASPGASDGSGKQRADGAPHKASAEFTARWTRYYELRDAGLDMYDAARDPGVGVGDRTGEKYERAYRQARGLPARNPHPARASWYAQSDLPARPRPPSPPASEPVITPP